jgi:hypothetical protein
MMNTIVIFRFIRKLKNIRSIRRKKFGLARVGKQTEQKSKMIRILTPSEKLYAEAEGYLRKRIYNLLYYIESYYPF